MLLRNRNSGGHFIIGSHIYVYSPNFSLLHTGLHSHSKKYSCCMDAARKLRTVAGCRLQLTYPCLSHVATLFTVFNWQAELSGSFVMIAAG
jgi:hypothetical protein